MIAKQHFKTLKPRMNTDKHGLSQGKGSLQGIRKAFFMSDLICMAEFLSPSVFIRVNPWLKEFFT